jgi:hypothetical protein
VVDEIERRVRERERQEAELAEARRRADRDEARRYEEQRRREQSRRRRRDGPTPRSARRGAPGERGPVIRLGPLDFGTPLALLLLLVLPALWLLRRRRRPAAIVFSRAAVLARGPRAGRAIARAIAALRMLAIAGLVLALARPRTGARAEDVTSEGINIVIAPDISSSMLAEDFQPQNRLEVAKAKMKQFVAGRTADRIGVVAFSGEALTQVPLTTDYPVVLAAIDNLQAGQLEDGTRSGRRSRPRPTACATRLGGPACSCCSPTARTTAAPSTRARPRRRRPRWG